MVDFNEKSGALQSLLKKQFLKHTWVNLWLNIFIGFVSDKTKKILRLLKFQLLIFFQFFFLQSWPAMLILRQSFPCGNLFNRSLGVHFQSFSLYGGLGFVFLILANGSLEKSHLCHCEENKFSTNKNPVVIANYWNTFFSYSNNFIYS